MCVREFKVKGKMEERTVWKVCKEKKSREIIGAAKTIGELAEFHRHQ